MKMQNLFPSTSQSPNLKKGVEFLFNIYFKN